MCEQGFEALRQHVEPPLVQSRDSKPSWVQLLLWSCFRSYRVLVGPRTSLYTMLWIMPAYSFQSYSFQVCNVLMHWRGLPSKLFA